MTTNWTFPTTISQYAEPGAESVHISWIEKDGFSALKRPDGNFIITEQPLKHISRSPKHDIRMKTWFIKATGYSFQNLPLTISGIELRLNANRKGRITDDTIHLCLNDEFVGTNKATLSLNPIKVYGGKFDKWSADTLSRANIEDPSFGIIMRFQSHPQWPHSEPMMIDSVELRIY